jgi:hypothetical protein
MTEKQWIETVAPAAVYCMKKYGYPASALIGQTCQETGYGKTSLVKVWNVIGMKATLLPYKSPTWSGKAVVKGTWEEVNGKRTDKDDAFREYGSIQDCLEDYCTFMRDGQSSPGVYKYRHILSWGDPEKVLRYITGKYATDHTYADKVLDIIRKHDLVRYDKEGKKVHLISNCGHDEHGQYSGGAAGDQTGTEWEIKPWYSRPWDVVLEPPTRQAADTIAELAIEAANNNKIGYDQGNRTSFDAALIACGDYPQNIMDPCETDCSAGVAAIVRATGRILGIKAMQDVSKDAYTGNLEKALAAAGFISHREEKYLNGPDYLGNGWILLYTGHHTAVSVSRGSKWEEKKVNTKITRTSFLAGIAKTAKTGLERHWHWENSTSMPPCEDGKSSCDRLVSRTLWVDFGVTWQKPGGWNSAELAVNLPKLGFTKETDLSKIKPGAVVMVGKMVNGNWDPTYHTFVVAKYNPATDLCDKYDFGDTWRMETPQPFKNVKLCEWKGRKVTMFFNTPEDPAPEPKKTPKECVMEGQEALNKHFGAKLKIDGSRGNATETAFIKALQTVLNRDFYGDGPMPVNGKLTQLTRAGLGSHFAELGEVRGLVTIVEIGMLLAGKNAGGVEYPGHYGAGLKAACGKSKMTAESILELFK